MEIIFHGTVMSVVYIIVINFLWLPKPDQNVLYLSPEHNSAKMGKFCGSAQNSAFRRKLWSLQYMLHICILILILHCSYLVLFISPLLHNSRISMAPVKTHKILKKCCSGILWCSLIFLVILFIATTFSRTYKRIVPYKITSWFDYINIFNNTIIYT